MKTIFCYLLIIPLLFITVTTFAQDYNVSGIVVNESGQPLRGATVFIGGSERVMPTDTNGHFNFGHVLPGKFQISVQMIGYASVTRDIVIKNAPVSIELKMQTKPILLNKVITDKRAWERNYQLFKENFLGTSENAKACTILNPELINFSTQKGVLMADADDFLVIENKRLGYRIRYLLKGFEYNSRRDIALYNGQCNFEELTGADDQRKERAKNREDAYLGSFMHFLRSVYSNSTAENGFITKPMFGYGSLRYDGSVIDNQFKAIVKNSPVKFDSLVTSIDTNFISLKFNQLYVLYDPTKSIGFASNATGYTKSIFIEKKASVLRLANEQAVVDRQGNYTDYRDFYIHGYWARYRVGDQLPLEYQSITTPAAHRAFSVNPMVAALQKWTDSIPQEKAYLHMDKPYYATGDTIWFKTYLTTGSRHQLSALSGSVYIDLVDQQNHIVKTIKRPVTAGMTDGDIVLDKDIPPGAYRIRAYTQWMRNTGADYFFDHVIAVIDPANFKKPEKDNSHQQADIQFFPESGDLVNDITTKVAFKAVGTNGLGVNIHGVITDNDNKEVAVVNTLHAGMGSFLLRPLAGKTYMAHVKLADSVIKDIALPDALNDGYVLNVYQPNKDSILVRIQASQNLQQSAITLIVHSSGEIIFASPITIKNAMSSIWLDTKTFPSGIAQFTIFDSNNRPLNERIAFIKNNDNLKISIDSAQTTYKSREHVQLNLNIKNDQDMPAYGSFSVAVIDQNKVAGDEDSESTIFSNLLLTSDIKGYVEKPNYYFSADTLTSKALDNLMLTQGYRRFEWQAINDVVSIKPAFQAEGFGNIISGVVTDLRHQPMEKAVVSLVSINARINKSMLTDQNGHFKFDSLIFADSAKFAIQARAPNNSDHAIITLDSLPRVTVNIKPSTADAAIINTNLRKAVDDGKRINLTGHVLKQVDIKALRNKKNQRIVTQEMFSLPDEQSADHIYTIPDPDSFIDLKSFIQARISNLRIETDSFGNSKVVDIRPVTTDGTSNEIVIVVNGAHVAGDPLTDMNLEDIAKIEVVRNNQAIINMLRQGSDHPAGFLFIVTKPPSERKHYYPNIVNIAPKGYNKVRQFYSPRYNHPNDIPKPDLRSTIYWDPYVNTDAAGKATIDFYNADGSGNYRVVIEGIDAAGELGRLVYHYKVEL
ncbi:carboxypeptidase regulatory-like domain-containing protein [Mucilaginibacter ximonensis]|uniref:Carboxypeptidase regulatory-like domain-containing protein n=1 Tax=Mucilaginibacter ximonensis TaxID=538021 RepID=A0ABW5YGD1_9SPHI